MDTLLLIEDQEFNRDILERRLKRRNFDVIPTENGLTGLHLAETMQPDLILLDMNLPDIDGWETARRLKANPTCAPIPIIGLSAHFETDAHQRAMDAGCDDYETKPINFVQLVEKIQNLIQKSKSATKQTQPSGGKL